MIFVLSGGGSKGAQKKATIVVSYPSGATCTVYNSSKTYTALDTSGSAAFVVDAGTWTVKATNGTYTKTESVTVAAGKYVEVELMFELILLNGADGCTSATGGWTNYTTHDTNGIYVANGKKSMTTNTIQKGSFTVLKAIVSNVSRYAWENGNYIKAYIHFGTASIVVEPTTTEKTITLALGTVTSGQVALQSMAAIVDAVSMYANMTVKKVWLQ